MHRTRIPSQTGFSMVELMVALVIGVILTGGVISVYISSKSSYNVSNGLGQVEQAGRSALNFIQPATVMAGYMGCSRPGSNVAASVINNVFPVTDKQNPVVPVYNFASPVFGYEANGTGIGAAIPSNGGQTVAAGPTPPQNASLWTPSLTWRDASSVLYNTIKSTLLQYNDVLMVHAAASNPAPLIAPYDDGTSLYIAPSTSSATSPVTALNFSAGEFAAVSVCDNSQATTFQISAVDATAGTLTYGTGGTPGNNGNWSTEGGPYTSAGTPTVQVEQTYVFYVGKGIDGWPALYEGSFNSSGVFQTQEMVSGVENMQVLYGVDTDTGSAPLPLPDQIPNNFETADQVQNADSNNGDNGGAWDTPNTGGYGAVVSVRIALVMQSDDNSIDKAPAAATTFHMLGTSAADSVSLTPPLDRRVRRYFVQTFSFRNMLP